MLFKVKFANGKTKQRIIKPVLQELVDLVLEVLAVSSVEEVIIFYLDSSMDKIEIVDQLDLDACVEDFRITNKASDLQNLRISLRAGLKSTDSRAPTVKLEPDSYIKLAPDSLNPFSSMLNNITLPPPIPKPQGTASPRFEQSRILADMQLPSEIIRPTPQMAASSVRESTDQLGLQRSWSQTLIKNSTPKSQLGAKSAISGANRSNSPITSRNWFTSTSSVLPNSTLNFGKSSPPPNSKVSDSGEEPNKYAQECRAYRTGYLANKWKQREVWDGIDRLLSKNQGLHISLDLYHCIFNHYWNDYVKNKMPSDPSVIQTLYDALEVDDIITQYIPSLRKASGLPPA